MSAQPVVLVVTIDLLAALELPFTEFALKDGTIWCVDSAHTMQDVVLEEAFLDDAIAGDDLALAVQLMVFELTFKYLAILLGDSTKSGQLATLEVAFEDCAIDLGHFSWSMHDVLVEDTLPDRSARANDLGLSV